MTAGLKRHDVDPNDLVRQYLAGASLRDLARHFDCDRYVIRRVLQEQGVTQRDRAEAIRLQVEARYPVEEIVRRYASGESGKRLSDEFGMHWRALTAMLERRGITPRSRSTATRTAIYMGYRVPRSMKSLPTLARPDAQPSTAAELAAARKRETTRSMQQPVERELLSLLPSTWADWVQVAVDRYNIDVASGSVAVEVHSRPFNPIKNARVASRAIQLADRGWHCLFVWPTPAHPISLAGAEQLIAHAKVLNGNPSEPRRYLVMRGCGEPVSAGQFDLEKWALVPSPIDPAQFTHGLHPSVPG